MSLHILDDMAERMFTGYLCDDLTWPHKEKMITAITLLNEKFGCQLLPARNKETFSSRPGTKINSLHQFIIN